MSKRSSVLLLFVVGCSSNPVAYQSGSPWPQFPRRRRARRPQQRRADAHRRQVLVLPHRQGHLQLARGRQRRHHLRRLRRSHLLRARSRRQRQVEAAHRRDHRLRRAARRSRPRLLRLRRRHPARARRQDGQPRSGRRPPTIPASTGAFINWFEGNVAIGPAGTLYAPNDNRFVYARRSQRRQHRRAAAPRPIRPGRSPAFDAAGDLYIGNNNLVRSSRARTLFAFDRERRRRLGSSRRPRQRRREPAHHAATAT